MNKIKFDLNDRTAVITGGAQGFGLDITKRFLDSGANVIIWDIDPKMIEKAQKDLDNTNLSSNIVDVSNYKEVENQLGDVPVTYANISKAKEGKENIIEIRRRRETIKNEKRERQMQDKDNPTWSGL